MTGIVSAVMALAPQIERKANASSTQDSKDQNIHCRIAALTASKAMTSEKISDEKKLGVPMDFSIPLNDFNGSEQTITLLNETFKFILNVTEDEEVKDIYQLDYLVANEEKKRIIVGNTLLKTSSRKNNGWDISPENAKNLLLLYPNTLAEKTMELSLTYPAYKVLSEKYGVQSRTEYYNTYELFQKIKQAVIKKDLKEGQLIGIMNLFGCWKY